VGTGLLGLIYIFGAPRDAEGAPDEEHAYHDPVARSISE
jgi:hypothetical protein